MGAGLCAITWLSCLKGVREGGRRCMTLIRREMVPRVGGLSIGGGGGSIEPPGYTPPKGAQFGTPKILPRLTPGPRR